MDPTLKLLTLINVSAARPGKRQRSSNLTHYDKITRKAAAAQQATASTSKVAADASPSKRSKSSNGSADSPKKSQDANELVGEVSDDDEGSEQHSSTKQQRQKQLTAFDAHFGSDGPHAQAVAKLPESVTSLTWSTSRSTLPALPTQVVVSTPALPGFDAQQYAGQPQVKVLEAFNAYVAKKYTSPTPLHKALAATLGSYADFCDANVALADRPQYRQVLAMHVMSHVAKTRRRVLKNNEKLAKLAANGSAADSDDLDLRDQGFTRPKVLILLPFRNSALEWVDLLTKFSLCSQVDNKARFAKEYNLPEGAVDKLADPAVAAKYPHDHIANFAGNIDDSFKLGLKVTRKSLKLFSGFYDSDVIVASPLGLRLGMEQDKGGSDFLSSIEMVVVDQTDVISMQNWEHLEYVLERLNHIPRQSRDTDFSRVKQFYLDNRAALFRQTVLLSAYDFAALRSVYNHTLNNVAGKVRTVAPTAENDAEMARVVSGVRHTFTRFEAANAHAEPDLRFAHFTSKTLAQLGRSAVSSSHTLVVVPSYFDFVRLDAFLRTANEQRKSGDTALSYTSISEYSTPKDIRRAREAFFSGKKRLLLLTERAHFYRRFKLRGVKTVVFYQVPQNARFFSEVLEFPFITKGDLGGDGEDEEDVDANEVASYVVYSRYDLMQLEKVVGSEQAKEMVMADKATWKFV
ncbi:related to UTP25-nucleolar protein required for 35S pre-RNA processing and 40S ribosomal subunit biogenesis [Sporisorium reilianum f. sp. reilianum]|uniref:U3 small nucleolar RNA-associated protein 25 n=1 Tax=Sporisorium reilianum f. sp. reilianum TaxID=72559 RepID=A0A2N8U802_9BASI|nr:related to UTP25-nucleolar protein required for 35S pre-RNA processing and 40S ribosomal subunit biogenesis [Sporisorium reilianum f. sp. reilianum]